MKAYREALDVLKKNIFIPVPLILADVAAGFAVAFLIVVAVIAGVGAAVLKSRGALPELTSIHVLLPLALFLLLVLIVVLFLKFCAQATAVAMTLNTLKGGEGTAGSIDEGIAVVRKNLKSLAALTLLQPLAVALGLALLILPGLVLWVMLWFSVVALVVEQRGAVAAMRSSARLVRRYPVASLIFVLLAVVIGMLAGAVATMLLKTPPIGYLFGTLLSPIVDGVASAWITAAAVLFYTERAG